VAEQGPECSLAVFPPLYTATSASAHSPRLDEKGVPVQDPHLRKTRLTARSLGHNIGTARDGRTDRQTDGFNALCDFLWMAVVVLSVVNPLFHNGGRLQIADLAA